MLYLLPPRGQRPKPQPIWRQIKYLRCGLDKVAHASQAARSQINDLSRFAVRQAKPQQSLRYIFNIREVALLPAV